MPTINPVIPSRRSRALVSALLAGTMLAGGAFAWSETGRAAPSSQGALGLPAVVNQAGFAELAATVKSAVVNISTTEPRREIGANEMPDLPRDTPFGEMFRRYFGQQRMTPAHALGSGFIVDPAGIIVTNNHVVDGAREITVTLDDGTSHQAKIVGRDAKTDLAVLKIDAGKKLPFVAFGDSDKARVGDWVVAVGNPFGLGGTVTAGIVSAHGRNLNEGPYDDYLQIDAPINPGNSGGPLFNQSGQVIGIDTAIYSPNGGSVGIGFAVPSNIAAKVVSQLQDHGSVERGWLGVQMQPLTPALAKAIGRPGAEGVLVNQVEPRSPAANAKLQQGDIVTAFDGATIKSPRDLALAVSNTKAGSTSKMTVWRDGHEQNLEVVIGTAPKEKVAAREDRSGEAPVGMALAPLTAAERGELGLNPSVTGVLVAQVDPDSRAAESGVREGDVIVRVGQHAVTTTNEAVAQIRTAQKEKKEAVPLLVMREGTTYYLALQLAQG